MAFQPPLGISDFRRIREDHLEYVDKTEFVSEILTDPAFVLSFSRPRRFGKTVNMSTLACFLEARDKDLSSLFEGLSVWADERAKNHFQKHPVIFVSFKDLKTRTFDETRQGVQRLLQDLYGQHRSLLSDGTLQVEEAERFERILWGRGSDLDNKHALKELSVYLHRRSGTGVVLLIDEYDTPIQSGYLNGFFDDVVHFFRDLLSIALKDNASLFKGILTGILRVPKENLFSGLNNLVVHSLLSLEYATAFGFTEDELDALFERADIDSQHREDVRSWYNGYSFGGQVIYNPWSILNYLVRQRLDPYWINTSANDLIMDLLARRGMGLVPEMETLLEGGTIEVRVQEDLVLRNIDRNPEALWSFLLFSGYLKPVRVVRRGKKDFTQLAIVNHEVHLIYEDVFLGWMQQGLRSSANVDRLFRALMTVDPETFEEFLEELLVTVASFQDPAGRAPEKLYHGFILGLLVHAAPDYQVRSNRESGLGRADVLVVPRKSGQPGAVLELKSLRKRKNETPEAALVAAAQQVRDRRYTVELEAAGADPIHAWAVVFDGKRVWARLVDEILDESSA